LEQLPEILEATLLAPWTQDMRSQLQDTYGDERSPTPTLDSRIIFTTTLPDTTLPFELIITHTRPRHQTPPQSIGLNLVPEQWARITQIPKLCTTRVVDPLALA